MSTWLLILTTGIYFGVAIDQYLKGSPAMCVVFAAYAVANIGMIFAAK